MARLQGHKKIRKKGQKNKSCKWAIALAKNESQDKTNVKQWCIRKCYPEE